MDNINLKLRLILFGATAIFARFVRLTMYFNSKSKISSFSSRPRHLFDTRARVHRPTGSLGSEETNNISDDTEDAKDLCF